MTNFDVTALSRVVDGLDVLGLVRWLRSLDAGGDQPLMDAHERCRGELRFFGLLGRFSVLWNRPWIVGLPEVAIGELFVGKPKSRPRPIEE